MNPEIPPELMNLAAKSRRVIELAAGHDFRHALAFARHGAPEVAVMDRNPRVHEAPPPLHAFVDDLWNPNLHLYEGAGLLYAVRIPEELQGAAARLALDLGAPLALKPLKDEWADVHDILPTFTRLPGGWRLHRHHQE